MDLFTHIDLIVFMDEMGPGLVTLTAPGQGGIEGCQHVDQGNGGKQGEIAEHADIEKQRKIANSCRQLSKDKHKKIEKGSLFESELELRMSHL